MVLPPDTVSADRHLVLHGTGHHDVNGKRLAGATGRHPATPARRNDQRPASLTEEREVAWAKLPVPQSKIELLQTLRDHWGIADQPDLGDADELSRVEDPGFTVLAETMMGDQLD